MATPKRARPNQRKIQRDQQGAQGRLVADLSEPPILTPRSSKVPAQDSDFLTTVAGPAVGAHRRFADDRRPWADADG